MLRLHPSANADAAAKAPPSVQRRAHLGGADFMAQEAALVPRETVQLKRKKNAKPAAADPKVSKDEDTSDDADADGVDTDAPAKAPADTDAPADAKAPPSPNGAPANALGARRTALLEEHKALKNSALWKNRQANIELLPKAEGEVVAKTVTTKILDGIKQAMVDATTDAALSAQETALQQLRAALSDLANAAAPLREGQKAQADEKKARDDRWAEEWKKLETAAADKHTGLEKQYPDWDWKKDFDQLKKTRDEQRAQNKDQKTDEQRLVAATASWTAQIDNKARDKAHAAELAAVPKLNKAKADAIAKRAKDKQEPAATLKNSLTSALARQRNIRREGWWEVLHPAFTKATDTAYPKEGTVAFDVKTDTGSAQVERPLHFSMSADVMAVKQPRVLDNSSAAALTPELLGKTQTHWKRLHTTVEVNFMQNDEANPKYYYGDAKWDPRKFTGLAKSHASVQAQMKVPLTDLEAKTVPKVATVIADKGDIGSQTEAAWDRDHPE